MASVGMAARRGGRALVPWYAGRMAARASGVPPTSTEALTLASLVLALDPEVRAAIGDVDRTLIQLSLQQSPWESAAVCLPYGADPRQDSRCSAKR